MENNYNTLPEEADARRQGNKRIERLLDKQQNSEKKSAESTLTETQSVVMPLNSSETYAKAEQSGLNLVLKEVLAKIRELSDNSNDTLATSQDSKQPVVTVGKDLGGYG